MNALSNQGKGVYFERVFGCPSFEIPPHDHSLFSDPDYRQVRLPPKESAAAGFSGNGQDWQSFSEVCDGANGRLAALAFCQRRC